MSAYEPAQWSDFALGQLGASAALLGLVFVGFSINLRDIVAVRQLVNRAGEAVVALGTVLATASAVLIPAQSVNALGVELLAAAVSTMLAMAWLQRGASAEARTPGSHTPRRTVIFRRVFGFGSMTLLALSAVTLIAGAGGGLFWWPAAVMIAYLGALTNAWVLVVEIQR